MLQKGARLPGDQPSRRDVLIAKGIRGSLEPPKDRKAERHLALELRYLQDPLKLATHIQDTLQNNELSKAVSLTRMASRTMQCTVSWNHIIDWLMARKSQKQAFKIYNEMKKRAQFPDSYTIVLLLRGLAHQPVHETDVGQALSLYHSLAAPNSHVKRTIMHTNATLRVCALHGDLSHLWGVAGRIPDLGPQSADSVTYTTILTAIREDAVMPGPRDDPEAKEILKEKAVHDGRQMWTDIMRKWRDGNLKIDEMLVCAMGRLMLIGSKAQDWDTVLSLVEQTMNIPRLAPRLGSKDRTGEHIRGIDANSVPPDEEHPVNALENQGPSNSGLFARPSNNTLSLILEACVRMAAQRVAYQYWDLLTGTYGIEPDLANYHTYLRLLRQARASGRVVETLRPLIGPDVPLSKKPMKKTFRIAMSACVRDKRNTHVMDNASTLIDFMQQTLSDIDTPTLMLYLELAVSTGNARHITTAFEFLAPLIQNMKSQVSFADASDTTIQEVMELFKFIVRTIDSLLDKSMVPRDEYSVWMKRRGKIAAFITRRSNLRSRQHTEKTHANDIVGETSEKPPGQPHRGAVSRSADTSAQDDENEEDIDETELEQLEHTSVTPVQSDESHPMKRQRSREEIWQARGERELAQKRQYRREIRQLRHFKRNSRKREKVDSLADSPLDL